jgi:CBS domain-containing protein
MRARTHTSTVCTGPPIMVQLQPQPPGRDGLPHRTLVGELMTRKVTTVDPWTGFAHVVAALRTHHHGLVPVVDDQRRVVGTVGASNLLARLARQALPSHLRVPEARLPPTLRRRAAAVVAGELMTAPVFTVNVDTTAAEAARLAARHHIHHIPVVDDQEHLVGMVCLCDLLGALDRSDDAIRSEVLYISVCRDLDVERSTLLVDCQQGRVALRATTALRSQAETLRDRVRAVEGLADLADDLFWQTDDTRTPVPGHRP